MDGQHSTRFVEKIDLKWSAGERKCIQILVRRGMCKFFTDNSKRRAAATAGVRGIILRKAASSAGFSKIARCVCTIFWHRPVNGVHSIENTCTYKGVFLID